MRSLFLVIVLAGIGMLWAQEPPAVFTVAVASFQLNGPSLVPAMDGMIADLFAAELAGRPEVRLIERRRLETLLDEQDLALAGIVDSNRSVETGHLVGAAYFLASGVIEAGATALFTVRLISSATGEVPFATVKSITGPPLEGLVAAVKEIAAGMVARLAAGAAPQALWVTQSSTPQRKGILIYAMSNVEDSFDQGVSWYLGPGHLKPSTMRTATMRATACSGKWPAASPTRCAPMMSWPGWAATSLPSSCPRRVTKKRRPSSTGSGASCAAWRRPIPGR